MSDNVLICKFEIPRFYRGPGKRFHLPWLMTGAATEGTPLKSASRGDHFKLPTFLTRIVRGVEETLRTEEFIGRAGEVSRFTALIIRGTAEVNTLIRLGTFRSTLDVRRLARHSFSEGWFGVRSSAFKPFPPSLLIPAFTTSILLEKLVSSQITKSKHQNPNNIQ